jgi:hypothetical protein
VGAPRDWPAQTIIEALGIAGLSSIAVISRKGDQRGQTERWVRVSIAPDMDFVEIDMGEETAGTRTARVNF